MGKPASALMLSGEVTSPVEWLELWLAKTRFHLHYSHMGVSDGESVRLPVELQMAYEQGANRNGKA